MHKNIIQLLPSSLNTLCFLKHTSVYLADFLTIKSSFCLKNLSDLNMSEKLFYSVTNNNVDSYKHWRIWLYEFKIKIFQPKYTNF